MVFLLLKDSKKFVRLSSDECGLHTPSEIFVKFIFLAFQEVLTLVGQSKI